MWSWILSKIGSSAITRFRSLQSSTAMRPTVHALNDGARAFYDHFGFESSPTDTMNLQLLIKGIRLAFGSPS
jgi:hypothetical protein